MKEPTYFDAVQNLTGNKALYGKTNGPIDKITLKDDAIVPTDSAISTEMARLQKEFDAQSYARNRANEYPSITL